MAVAASALMFAACGDDVTEIHQDGMAVLEAGEKLSEQACDTANVGEMLFVMDSSEAFICDGKSWQTLKGEKGEDGKDGSDGKDGKDGEKGEKGDKGSKGDSGDDGNDGKDGEDGNNGTSCTAKSVKNAAGLEGLEVTCGETVVDTIWNGAKGESGNDGVGCSAKDEGDGSVTLTCGEGKTTLYKAVCGTKPYDPAKSFCFVDEVYELCDGEIYDPAKSFCLEGELYSCGDKPYDPEKQYCLEVTRNETKIYSVEALLTDARDEQNIQVYKTVKICNAAETSCQTWMAENLNYSVNPGEQSWCYYNDASNCDEYGRLYTWAAAVGKSEDECGNGKTCNLPSGDIRGVCPEGWHVPTNDEFSTLYDNVGGSDYAGITLKSASGWNSNNGIDAYGFSALPAGNRGDSGEFYGQGVEPNFWSSTENDATAAWGMGFSSYDAFVYESHYYKDNGFSLRCLKD